MARQTFENTVANTWTKPIPPVEKIPVQADAVIIGGGIVGVSTAWFLAKQGVDVVLLEKGHIAGEQSGRNWGWVRVQGRDTREIPMMLESMRIWESLEDEIGEDVGFTRGGCFFTANSTKELQSLEDWVDIARDYEIDTRLINATELKQHVRGSAVDWAGAMVTMSDGRAEPHKAAPAIARAAERSGSVLEHPVTPASFRYFVKFLPALMREFKIVRLSFGREFIDEWRTPKTWELDKSSNTVRGFHVATGFSGHGFGLGPGAGKAIAGMLTGTDTGIDLSSLRLSRFFDGSPIRPQSAI